MMPITPRSLPVIISAEQRADAGRGQRREDGHRVDVALVEHAQHDVDADDRGQDQPQLVGERGLVGVRGAEEGRGDRRRQRDVLRRLPDRARPRRPATRQARCRIERARRELGDVVDLQRRSTVQRCWRTPTAASARRCWKSGRACPAPAASCAQAGLRLEDHAVLVGLGEDGRDDALAEGVVERVVDRARRDRQPRGGVAVDVDQGRQARRASVGCRRCAPAARRAAGDQLAHPLRDVGGVDALERERGTRSGRSRRRWSGPAPAAA